MGSYHLNVDHMLYLVCCEWSRWSLVSVLEYLVENEFDLQCVVDSKLACNRVSEAVVMETKGWKWWQWRWKGWNAIIRLLTARCVVNGVI